MADARHNSLLRIAAIQSAQLGAAQQDVADAARAEQPAQAALRTAEQATLDAATDWHAAIDQAGFQPELARAFAGRLLSACDAGAEAKTHAHAVAADRTATELEWKLAEARNRQAERRVRESRKMLVRARDERALDITSDRVSFEWSVR